MSAKSTHRGADCKPPGAGQTPDEGRYPAGSATPGKEQTSEDALSAADAEITRALIESIHELIQSHRAALRSTTTTH
ncbi:MAG TPA: hypothetical protein VHT51_06775 [Micropepsaceae bacterium]|nr:hypothetical protein [Micropepsaceae bacterium]